MHGLTQPKLIHQAITHRRRPRTGNAQTPARPVRSRKGPALATQTPSPSPSFDPRDYGAEPDVTWGAWGIDSLEPEGI